MKAERFRIDPNASRVSLEASQLGLVKHSCRFTRFHGSVALTEGRSVAQAELKISAESLSSAFGRALDRVAARVLLESDRHPWVTVRASNLRLLPGRLAGEVTATLTLRGRTAPVPLNVRLDERRCDGSVRFSVEGRVDRREWGVAESVPGLRLGNHISIRAAICAVPA